MTSATPLKLTNPVFSGRLRRRDSWGEGHFGAPRGRRQHNGIDIVARVGDDIRSPIDATLVRVAAPYDDDLLLSGVLLEGRNHHAGLAVKIFYVDPLQMLMGRTVRAGQTIGLAQSLAARYPGITNHIHLEVRHDGELLDPQPLIARLR